MTSKPTRRTQARRARTAQKEARVWARIADTPDAYRAADEADEHANAAETATTAADAERHAEAAEAALERVLGCL